MPRSIYTSSEIYKYLQLYTFIYYINLSLCSIQSFGDRCISIPSLKGYSSICQIHQMFHLASCNWCIFFVLSDFFNLFHLFSLLRLQLLPADSSSLLPILHHCPCRHSVSSLSSFSRTTSAQQAARSLWRSTWNVKKTWFQPYLFWGHSQIPCTIWLQLYYA